MIFGLVHSIAGRSCTTSMLHGISQISSRVFMLNNCKKSTLIVRE